MAALGVSWPLFGASVSRECDEAERRVDSIAAQCARLLGTEAPDVAVTMVDARGPGYGQPWSAAEAASDMARESEGLILDPIYTAKTFAALVQLSATGLDGPVVFWHTGGMATALEALVRKDSM